MWVQGTWHRMEVNIDLLSQWWGSSIYRLRQRGEGRITIRNLRSDGKINKGLFYFSENFPSMLSILFNLLMSPCFTLYYEELVTWLCCQPGGPGMAQLRGWGATMTHKTFLTMGHRGKDQKHRCQSLLSLLLVWWLFFVFAYHTYLCDHYVDYYKASALKYGLTNFFLPLEILPLGVDQYLVWSIPNL